MEESRMTTLLRQKQMRLLIVIQVAKTTPSDVLNLIDQRADDQLREVTLCWSDKYDQSAFRQCCARFFDQTALYELIVNLFNVRHSGSSDMLYREQVSYEGQEDWLHSTEGCRHDYNG